MTLVKSLGALCVSLAMLAGTGASGQQPAVGARLMPPATDAASPVERAPDVFRVKLETSKGAIVIETRRAWAPRGADRWYQLVRIGYYDGVRFTRVVKGKWAQFGINGDPAVAKAWRERTIPDEPRVLSNTRGTVAFAFAVPDGRTTQVFINLKDNAATHDAEPFVPFGRVVEGMSVVDALYDGYGENAGSGIRSGKQGPIFDGGNAYLAQEFPRLDFIVRATVLPEPPTPRK